MIIRDKSTGKFLKGTESPQKGKGQSREGNKKCPICHNIFHYKRSSSNPPPKTCSKKCRYKSASITGTHHIFKKCCICQRLFGLPPSIMNDHNKKGSRVYCSRECRWKTRMRWSENQKQNAQRLVRVLINQGVILPRVCEECEKKEVEGHHYKGYERKNWLVIKWLCRKHHIQDHERMRREGINKIL